VSFIQKLFTSRDNQTSNVDAETGNIGNTFVGQQDRIWWNPDTNAFYYSDGNTAGGILITGGASGNGTVGGANTYVQYNNNGNFGGDPNFTFNSATSTLTITNIVANTITGGAGGTNTQVLFNDSGNINGNAKFTFNKVSGNLTLTGTAYLGNVYPTANNVSNIGTPNNRFNDIWLGSGNINLIDDTLNINQEINAQNGNLVISGGNGLIFGQFAIFSNTIATQNPTANINIGLVGDTAYVDIDRPLVVNSTGGGLPAFAVEQNGTVSVFNANAAANTPGALNIVGTTDRSYQNVTNTGGMLHITAPGNAAARVTIDAFGTAGGSGVPAAIIGRVGRGTAASPTAVQANDIMVRLGAVGWATTGFTAPAPTATAIEFVAVENFTDAAQGTKITFNTANVGSNSRSVSAVVQANGVSFLNNTIANSGITFRDGTFQNTAFVATSVVSSLTAGAGIGLSASTGNITIQNTGVLGVNGTTNQINVANVGNVLTLSLPQNLNTTANVQLNQLTVNDLIILGNVSNVIPQVVGGKIIYVANTATTLNDIDVSGLYSGNAANNYSAGMIYSTVSNTWVMDIGNSVGITSEFVYSNSITANGNIHLGNAYNDYDFTNALLQGDINIDSYGQYVLKNHSQTANASADLVAVANNGDDSSYYIDMGINSNVYANADYAVTGYNDGYLYVNGGNLVIGTQTAGKVVNFFTGGTDDINNIRGTISDTGLSMVGNVTANNMISTNATIGNTVSAIGNVTGGNLLAPAGIVSAAGNIYSQNVNTGIVSATGNITGANIRTVGSISTTGNVVSGNLSVTGVTNVANITTANITAGNITSAIVSATGNISGPNIIATIMTVSALLSVSGNITGGNFLTDGLISTTGNVTSNYFIGNGSQLTGITLAKIANGTSQVNIPTASGNANISIGGTSNVAVFASTGEYVTGIISASGNIVTGANIVTPGAVINSSISTSGNIIGANIRTAGLITAAGNVIGGNLVGQNLTAGRVAIVGSGKEVADDGDFTYDSTTNVLSVAGNINAANFNGNVISSGNISTTANVTGNWIIASGGNTLIDSGVSTTGNVTANYFFGNGSQLTGVLTTITPNALSSTVHVAAVTTGNVANIITDATTAATPNTLVLRDSNGLINVGAWTINARLSAANTTATATDYWIGLSSKNLTVTLPNAANGAVQGRQYIIADTVQSGAPGDTIVTEVGATIIGGSLTQQGQSKMCVFIAANNTWYCN